jgi:D-alanyl-D-alanine carboxypeptidase
LPDHVHLESFESAVNRKWRERQNYERTLRSLFNHGPGLSGQGHLESFANSVAHQCRETQHLFSPEDLIEYVFERPALFEAGTSWAYSDTGYILLGLVIEEVTGRSYYEEIRERFLTPFDLRLTTPSDQLLLSGLAAGYMETENAFGFPQKTLQADGRMVWHPGLEWTGGGLVSNAGDLARWGSLLFEGHAMTGDYLTELLKGVPVSPDESDIYYGAGVGIYRSGPFGPVYGHGGWIPGYTSSLRHYPDQGVTIAFQINTDIGIVDDSTAVISEMEKKLAETVISRMEKGL